MPRAGLGTASVTEAGAALADEVGSAQLSMGLLAERLGVKTPSLYKHVAGLADLHHRIAVLAMDELADAIRDAIAGRSGRDALVGGAQAMRTFARRHPGRYESGNAALLDRTRRSPAPGQPPRHGLVGGDAARIPVRPRREIHALRMLRSILHGFTTLEAIGSFQVDTDVDDSFTWMIGFIDQGLKARWPDLLPAH